MWDDWTAIEKAQNGADSEDAERYGMVVPFRPRTEPPPTVEQGPQSRAVEPYRPSWAGAAYKVPEPEPLTPERRLRGLRALRKAIGLQLEKYGK